MRKSAVRELVVNSGGVPVHVLDHRPGLDHRPASVLQPDAAASVVLLHGGGRTSRDWDDVAACISALGYRSVAFDLRGHGGTPVAPWTWDLALADVAAVIRELGLIRPAVVGHSLGGMVAALWAAGHEECPLAVNIDGHGNPTRPDQYAGLDRYASARAHHTMQAFLTAMMGGAGDHLRVVLRSVNDLDLFAVYRHTRCRLAVIFGEESMADLLPLEIQHPWEAYATWVRQQLAATARVTRALSVVTMPTGHDAHLEAPETVASLIHHWLSTTPRKVEDPAV